MDSEFAFMKLTAKYTDLLNKLTVLRNRNTRLLEGLHEAWDKIHPFWMKSHTKGNMSTPESDVIKAVLVILETAIADAIAAAEGE